MDVTALLNENYSAVDQQRKGGETFTLPTRSRTPWDAGGYSLPLSTTTMKIFSPEVDQLEAMSLEKEDSPIMIPFTSTPPTFPSHKFTDSRSSFSSFASSTLPSATYSTTHSRYSSISTLNSPGTFSSDLPEPRLSPKGPIQSVEMTRVSSRDDDEVLTRHHHDHSPTRSFDTLAQIVEDHHSTDFPSPRQSTVRQRGNERQFLSQQPEETRLYQFPPRHSRSVSNGGSISSRKPLVDFWATSERDSRESSTGMAISADGFDIRQVDNISRPASPSDTLLIKRTTLPTLHLDTQERHLQVPSLAEPNNPTKTHKRAISAPNFAAMDINRSPFGRMAHEPTPPNSDHPDRASPQASFEQSPPESPPSITVTASTEPVCMYIDDCDTDSPQRKAISHIFGRNKMCTRMIPEHLWVHLCRKHYQRCRYRDQDKWAKAQCDLVQIQIRRIHDWSMANQANGSGIHLQNWTLTMRKREKVRREKLAQQANRKRSASSQDEDENAVEGDETGYPSTTTKIPDWLVSHCEKEYTTQGILVVFNRLHQDILDGLVGPNFPDLELLPNLVTPDGNGEKRTASKPPSKKAHQRSQSLSTVVREPFIRDHIPSPKRRRANDEPLSERVLPPLRQTPRHPTYPSINEHQVSNHILPCPTPQRMNGSSMAAHIEAGDFRRGRRPGHRRSHSDFPRGMHSSAEAQRGGYFTNMAAAANGRPDLEYQPRYSGSSQPLEAFSAGVLRGHQHGIEERETSTRPNDPHRLGEGYVMRSREEEMPGSQDRMMGLRSLSIGSQEQMMAYRQHSVGAEDYRKGGSQQYPPIFDGRTTSMIFAHNRHNSSPVHRP